MTFKKLKVGFDEQVGRDDYQLIPLNDYKVIDSRYASFLVMGVAVEHKRVLV